MKIKMIKNLPRFIKYTKDKQYHQNKFENTWHELRPLKQTEKSPSNPLPSPLSAGDK